MLLTRKPARSRTSNRLISRQCLDSSDFCLGRSWGGLYLGHTSGGWRKVLLSRYYPDLRIFQWNALMRRQAVTEVECWMTWKEVRVSIPDTEPRILRIQLGGAFLGGRLPQKFTNPCRWQPRRGRKLPVRKSLSLGLRFPVPHVPPRPIRALPQQLLLNRWKQLR